MQSTTSNHKSLSPLESLAQSTAFTLKVHAGMIMSIDTKLERISDNVEKLTASQAETNTKMDRLTANVDKVAGTVTQLSAVVQMLAGIVQ